jgi:NADH-quinone oxidoreductase subunit C
MNNTINALSAIFDIIDWESHRTDLFFVTAKKSQLPALLSQLQDRFGYTVLVLMTAVDWLENGQLQLLYMLHNHETGTDLGVKIYIDRDNPVMDSIHTLWPHARVYQQELREMFGIIFPGSPGLYEPMILEGWQGPPPMRRDFDTLKYSQEAFDHRPRETHAPEEYMKQQLYPED